jgi:hypothetical protein
MPRPSSRSWNHSVHPLQHTVHEQTFQQMITKRHARIIVEYWMTAPASFEDIVALLTHAAMQATKWGEATKHKLVPVGQAFQVFKGAAPNLARPLDLYIGFLYSFHSYPALTSLWFSLDFQDTTTVRMDFRGEGKTLSTITHFRIRPWTCPRPCASSFGIPDGRYHRDDAVKVRRGLAAARLRAVRSRPLHPVTFSLSSCPLSILRFGLWLPCHYDIVLRLPLERSRSYSDPQVRTARRIGRFSCNIVAEEIDRQQDLLLSSFPPYSIYIV